jgi:hypothetical protein
VAALLLQLVLVAGPAQARSAMRHTELRPLPVGDALLAPPVKRGPDVVRPERVLRLNVVRHATALRAVQIDPGLEAALAPTIAPARARSHAQRLRVRPPDDPPQPAVSA